MELSISSINKIVELINSSKEDKNSELEIRLKESITYEKFIKIFKKLSLPKENNGLGLKYKQVSSLDVFLKKIKDIEHLRLSIDGQEEIQKYWLTSNIEDIKYNIIEKYRKDQIDITEYNIKIALNSELPEDEIINKNKILLTDNINNKNQRINKHFRFKNRYSIETDDNLFIIDLTSIKSGDGITFRDSNTLKNNITFEIEIEYINSTDNNTINSKDIATSLMKYCALLLGEIQDNEILLKKSLSTNIISYYNDLIHYKNYNNSKSKFITANPMTLHKINLLKNSDNINLYNGYSVTLKADGKRYLLLVHKNNDETLNGKIYLIDSNFDILDTGYTDSYYNGTLIEGELVSHNNKTEFYCYDLLYSKGYDRRKNKLYNTDKFRKEVEENGQDVKWSRLDYLEAFMKSGSRKITNGFNNENCINIKKKLYKFSTSPDGSDIFTKTKELWDGREYANFDVDGLIFTPINEQYPYSTGTWQSLLKWKPHYYNTIDFLIKTVKYNDNDIKSPYSVNIKRPDGTFESVLKQFKTLKLYVGTRENVYDQETHRMKIVIKPIEFNPYKLDNEQDASIYNTCNILLDEKEKMSFINDKNINEELLDDIIAEFRYNDDAEIGFKWIPLRIRHDKTLLYKEHQSTFGNMDTTANDIFRTYKYPVTEEMITTGKVPIDNSINGVENTLGDKGYFAEFDSNTGNKVRLPYQNFHNHYIKAYLYMYVSPAINEELNTLKGKLFDYACGKGVDINKIMKGKYAEVVGMDYDLNNIKFAIENHKGLSSKYKPRAFYFRGDGSKLIFPNQACGFTDTDKVSCAKYIPIKYYFDVVSVQFAMHYFFENEIKLRSFIQNLNDNLKIGGYYIGTCFDGKRIYDSLKGQKIVSGKMFSGDIFWSIEKKYKTRLGFDTDKPIYGKEINVFVKSIGRAHPEYLVNFNFFNKIMKEYGFEMIFIKSFQELYEELIVKEESNSVNKYNLEKNQETAEKMSEDEKKFSFLNNAFCYKKVSNSADSLLSKLINKIDKEEKTKLDIKLDEKIKVIDENTENTIGIIKE